MDMPTSALPGSTKAASAEAQSYASRFDSRAAPVQQLRSEPAGHSEPKHEQPAA